MSTLSKRTRIFYFFCYIHDKRSILLAAYDLGLLDGRYAFVATDVHAMDFVEWTYKPELTSIITNGTLGLTVKKPSGPVYEEFLREVIKAFSHPQFDGFPHLPLTADISEVEPYAGM